MGKLSIHQFPYMDDNYGVLVHCDSSGATAVVDCGDAKATMQALDDTGWTLSDIWITHHHGDHTAGLQSVKSATNATVTGPVELSSAIPGVDVHVNDGDEFTFADHKVKVIHTPGHTTDMMNYYLPDDKLVFTGDTLFTMGCGRLFEGDAHMMHNSLQKLAALPADTVVYCSHEYTLANAKFALSVDAGNAALVERSEQMQGLRDKGMPTVPTTIADELATNPFMRANDPAIRATLGMPDDSDADVLAEIRRRKDNF